MSLVINLVIAAKGTIVIILIRNLAREPRFAKCKTVLKENSRIESPKTKGHENWVNSLPILLKGIADIFPYVTIRNFKRNA
jgi:hypothetical protein